MNEIVTKNDLNRALYTKQLIAPAIDAIAKINAQAMNYDPAAYDRVQEFYIWLGGIASEADAVIAAAAVQFENKPEIYINAAGMRLHAIQSDIGLEQKSAQNTIDAYQFKTNELRQKGFSQAEIEAVLTYPQPELDAHQATIAELEVEQKNIERFLADAPRYDLSLLDGAKLKPFLLVLNDRQAGE